MIEFLAAFNKSEAYVAEFYRRIAAAAERMGKEFRSVFVDDGASEGAAAQVLSIADWVNADE